MKATIFSLRPPKGLIDRSAAGGFSTRPVEGKKAAYLPSPYAGYIAAILTNSGHTVRVSDADLFPADLSLIHTTAVCHREELDLARRIRHSGGSVAFFGSMCSAIPDLFLKFADLVIAGEPEEAAIQIAAGHMPSSLMRTARIENLDELPFPSWEQFDVDSFSCYPSFGQGPVLPVLSSRGCPLS